MSTYEEDFWEGVRALLAGRDGLELPPPVFQFLGGRVMEYLPGEAIQCVYPVPSHYANPSGLVPGGVLTAMLDNCFSPLALLVTHRACSSLNINTTFLRPVKADDGEITAEARVRAVTRSLLFLEGRLTNQEGRTAATATGTLLVQTNGT
jgi:uncharacterized protein (TIGR00369 family)